MLLSVGHQGRHHKLELQHLGSWTGSSDISLGSPIYPVGKKKLQKDWEYIPPETDLGNIGGLRIEAGKQARETKSADLCIEHPEPSMRNPIFGYNSY